MWMLCIFRDELRVKRFSKGRARRDEGREVARYSPIPCEASIEWSCEGVVEDVGGVSDGVRELGRAVLPLELDGVGGVVGIGDVGGEVGDDNGDWGLGIGD